MVYGIKKVREIKRKPQSDCNRQMFIETPLIWSEKFRNTLRNISSRLWPGSYVVMRSKECISHGRKLMHY